MRHYKLKKILFFVFAVILLLQGKAVFADGELVSAMNDMHAFEKDSIKKNTRANWRDLSVKLEQAASIQPKKNVAAKGYFLASKVIFGAAEKFKINTDYLKARELSKKSLNNCRNCEFSAEAQLINGLTYLALKEKDQAYKELMKVELNYPNSPEIDKARKMLATLRPGGAPPPKPETERPIVGTSVVSIEPASIKTDKAVEQVKVTQPTAKTPASSINNSEKSNKDNKTQNAKPNLKQPKPFKLPAQPKARKDGKAQVYAINFSDYGQYTVVTAYLDKVSSYTYNMTNLNNGRLRIYADLKNAVLASNLKSVWPANVPLVELSKINQLNDNTVRFVVDLKNSYVYNPVFADKPPRMEFYIAKEASLLPSKAAEPPADIPVPKEVPQEKPKSNINTQSSRQELRIPSDSLARQLGLKVKRVVIDPGHGGKDSGAHSGKLKEKDIVLKASKMLAAKLEKKLGLQVVLTRTNDSFVTLERRAKIAKDNKADLFISLHVNAHSLPKVEGFETYILNFTTDKSAMAVAARENASSNKSIAELSGILNNIAKSTKVKESKVLASSIHRNAIKAIQSKYKVRDLGVKEAPFFVLVGSEVPAVLIEIGFISNSQEASRLSTDAYLDLITDGICKGIGVYRNSLQ